MNYNKLLQIAKQFEKTAGDVVDLFPKTHDEYEPLVLDSDVDLMPGSERDIEWCTKCGALPDKKEFESFFSNTGKPLNSISLCKECIEEILSLNDLKRT